jgi:hypothetical protein
MLQKRASLSIDVKNVERTSLTSDNFFADPCHTLIFLDWDDTLFPTTEIFERWQLPRGETGPEDLSLSEEQSQFLEFWRCALYQYLYRVSRLSDRCVILTSAESCGWVESCINRFAPNLTPLFVGNNVFRIVNVREVHGRSLGKPVRFSEATADMPKEEESSLFARTVIAIRKEAAKFYSKHKGDKGRTWKNMISCSGARWPDDYNPFKEVSFTRSGPATENLREKTLRLRAQPGIASLTRDLGYLVQVLSLLVHHDGNFDMDLSDTSDPCEAAAKALDIPELLVTTPSPCRRRAPAAEHWQLLPSCNERDMHGECNVLSVENLTMHNRQLAGA